MTLSQKQIKYGFYYYFKDEPNKPKSVVELSEYHGQRELTINCTQLNSSYKPKDKKRIVGEWITFLKENPKAFSKLTFGTRMTQELFDAVCHQQDLLDLEIKWGAYKDLSLIQNLSNLSLLYLGSGAGVESIEAICKIPHLKGLYVENFKKITNYSCFTQLKELESLTICGDGLGPQYIQVEDVDFLKDMKQLKFLQLTTVRLKSKDYRPILNLSNLQHLTLGGKRDIKKVHTQLVSLPKLTWGLIKEKPELYT